MASRKILVVDDDSELTILIKAFLELEGYIVAITTQSEDILPSIHEYQPHAIILDYYMQHRNATDILREIQADQEIGGIPVFVTSGDNVQEEVLAQGAAGFLPKPFTPENLLSQLNNRLS